MTQSDIQYAVSHTLPRSPPTGSWRASVLMVDDQPARLLSYEAILAGLGVHCVRALSGTEALARLLQQEFAVVLLDVNMPGMDGFETARMIRQHPRMERLPIIFITGVNSTEFDQLKGYEVGAIDYICIPVVPEILRSKVAILVELQQRRSELQLVNQALAAARAQLYLEHSQAMAECETQFNAVIEHVADVAVVLRAELDVAGAVCGWCYHKVNRNASELLGVAREQLVGRALEEVPCSLWDATTCAQVLATQEAASHPARLAGREFLVTIFPISGHLVVGSAADITERKHAEAFLRASEARYRALIENAPVAVAHNALDGRFEYVNKAFCQLVGYSAAELRDKSWQDITHPADVASDQALSAQVRSGEIAHYTLEKRYIRKDGVSVWVSLFGNFVMDEGGTPIQGVAVAIDITERIRADQAIKEGRDRLMLAKAAAQLGTHDWDVQSGTIQWDERTCELWGIDPGASVTYAVFAAALHSEDRASTEEAVERALDPDGDGRFFAAYRVINRRDGRARWIEATGRVLFENRRAVRLVGTVHDITDRVLADERLRSSEERFRDLANNIDQFAWTCDKLGHATWYNDRWYQYTGTTFDEMCGDGWTRVHHPAHVDRVMAHLSKCFETGQPWEDTFPLKSKDGSYRWFLSRAVPIRSTTGHVIRWFGTNTDVTEQRNLQEALKEADRRKDEFLAMLAHELRNPAAAISNAAEVLARLLLQSDVHRSVVAVVQRQTVHLTRLLDDLLDVARITQGHIELRREVVSLPACLELALETAHPLIRDKRHRLTVTQTFQPLHVDADKMRLAQCLANLLINAAKYSEPGGEIQVRPYAQGSEAVVEITDTGIGISPEFLPHAFDLFAQSERSLDRSQGGLGIGLSVCRQLLVMHGGSVTGASAGLGHGSTFTIRLPLVDEPARSHPTGEATSAAIRRVMIVDDNHDAADSLSMLLELEGHQVMAVYSGEHALEQALAFDPQVVLLDIGLPQMDGYEVARRLSTLVPSARLIALTGYGQPEDRQHALDAGFDAHLVKPVDLGALQRALIPGEAER